MIQILLEIPEDSLLALRVSVQEIGAELRLAAAVKLFELGRLSSGAAAELAGIPKPLFLVRLSDYGASSSASASASAFAAPSQGEGPARQGESAAPYRSCHQDAVILTFCHQPVG